MKRLNCIVVWTFVLTMALTLNLWHTPVAQAAEENIEVRLSPAAKTVSNIYYTGSLPIFNLEIQNYTSASQTVTLTYLVTDKDGSQVWSAEPENITIAANSTTIRGCSPKLGNLKGFFRMTAAVSGDFGQAQSDAQSFTVAADNSGLSEYMGLSCHFGKVSREQVEKSKDLIANAGVGWVRDEILWEAVETKAGVYSIPAYHENYVNQLVDNGINILLILNYGNAFYENHGFPITADGIQAYANYCAFMAEHFKGRINTFEIWNEPNYSSDKVDGENRYPTGAEYAALLKAAYSAIKAVDPNITVVGGSTTTLSTSDTYNWMNAAMKAGAGQAMDVLSFHPYANTGVFCDEYSNSARDILAVVEDAQQLLSSNGVGTLPLWITEFGSSTWEGSDSQGKGYSLRDQAINHVRAAVLAQSDPQVEKFFIYNLKQKGTTATNKEHNFGLLGFNYEAKESYLSMAAMNHFLSGRDMVKAYNSTSRSTRYFSAFQYRGEKDDKDVFVLWKNTTKSGTVTLTAAADLDAGAETALTGAITGQSVAIHTAADADVRVYDMFGNEVTNLQGSYSVTGEPLFVVCESSASAEAENEITVENGRVSVRGKNAMPGADVTMLARQQNAIGNPIYYIKQTTADAAGEYSFAFTVKSGDICEIYVYDGKSRINNNVGNETYEITMKYYIGGEPLTDIKQVQIGDKIKAEARVKLREGSENEGLMLYGAVSDEQVLVEADASKLNWNTDTAAGETEITVNNAADLETLRFMLWNEKMQPLMKAAGLKE